MRSTSYSVPTPYTLHPTPRRRAAFTLIELLVAIFFVAVALVGVMAGLRLVAQADVRAQQAELLQRLGQQKMHEIAATGSQRTADDHGNFADQGMSDINWSLDVRSTGDENLDAITVTVTEGSATQSLSTLVFTRPTTGNATQ